MTIPAAFHVHSTWSYDGQWTLDQIATAFRSRGYNLVFVTEHDQGFTEERRRAHREACERASRDQLLIVPGIEYSDPSNRVHVLVCGDIPFLGAGKETQYLLEQATDLGGVCVFAHPSRKDSWQLFRKQWLRHLTAVEIWNRKADGWSPSHEARNLVLETGASSIVGLDFHNAKQFFPLAVCVHFEGEPDVTKALQSIRYGSYHCEAFGMHLESFTSGILGCAARVLESSRRLAVRAFRSAIPRSCPKAEKFPQNVYPRSGVNSHGPTKPQVDAPR